MEVDYSATVDKKIPQCEALTTVSMVICSKDVIDSFGVHSCKGPEIEMREIKSALRFGCLTR